ncbi:MAG: sulfotransferase [Rhodobacter sp.]|nr:sulfotransferase [Rhodobacter sp.]
MKGPVLRSPITLPKDLDGYVFVVTYGRSGSTLVQNLLNAIDGYCIRGENANALVPLAMSWHLLTSNPNVTNAVTRKVPTTSEHPWYGAEEIRAFQYGRNLANAFVREVLAPPVGTRVAGFKEIRWTNDPAQFAPTLNFAYKMFPNTRFVFNTRDHDEVAKSGWWADMSVEAVKAKLARADAMFAEYLEKHPERGVRIHYNDYTADLEALKPMYDFLGEPFDRDRVKAVLDTPLTHLKKKAPDADRD